jgi:hypothetical protein
MTHDEMIAVIEHHKNGGEVECISKTNGKRWVYATHIDDGAFDFIKFNYRIKPEPMTLWLEINKWGKVVATHYEKPKTPTYITTTLKKFVEVTE